MYRETFEDIADLIGLVLENDYETVKYVESRVERGVTRSQLSDELRDMCEEAIADAIGERDTLPAMLLRELALGWGSSVWDEVAERMMSE